MFRLETLTPAGTYGLYLGFIVIGLILAYYCYPETSQLPRLSPKTMSAVTNQWMDRGIIC